MEGFEVDAAGHGEEALAAASNATPDVVVLDLMMPGMDGHEIFVRLRAMPETAEVPVIFLTARGKDDSLEGVDAVYMQKPFDTIELVRTARSLTEGTP
jgi:two-component system phosphate regulon response regulator PhoB